MLALLLLLVLIAPNILSKVGENSIAITAIKEVDSEDYHLATLLRKIIEMHFPDCSFGLGLDHPILSKPLQEVLIWNQRIRHRPLVMSRMDTFPFNPEDYTWVWKREHLLSFRSHPPELRSKIWPGGKCSFNLILATNASTTPELIMYSAASFRVRHLQDPFFIHTYDTSIDLNWIEEFLLGKTARGMKLKLLSRFDHDQRRMMWHTVCYCCTDKPALGEDTVNPPVTYLNDNFLARDLVFPDAPRNTNGSTVIMGHPEPVDLRGAAVRKKKNLPTTYTEELLLLYESIFNLTFDVLVPEMAFSEFSDNGSLAGMMKPVVFGDVEGLTLIVYTDVSMKAVSLTYPMMNWHVMIVTRHPRLDIKWYVILQPFGVYMWIVLCVSVIICATIIHSLEAHYRHDSTKWNRKRKVGDIWSKTKTLTCIFIGQPSVPLDSNNSVPVFLALFFCFALIITCCYQTKLVSLITFPPTEHLPLTAEELVFDSKFRWGSTAMQVQAFSIFAGESEEGSFQHKAVHEAEIVASLEECLDKALKEDFACAILDVLYRREKNNFLDEKGELQLNLAPYVIASAFTGSCYQRDNVWIDHVNRVNGGLLAGNIVDHIESAVNYHNFIRQYYKKRNENLGKSSDSESLLNIEKLESVFYMWLIGLGIGCVVLAIEMRPRRKRIPFLL